MHSTDYLLSKHICPSVRLSIHLSVCLSHAGFYIETAKHKYFNHHHTILVSFLVRYVGLHRFMVTEPSV